MQSQEGPILGVIFLSWQWQLQQAEIQHLAFGKFFSVTWPHLILNNIWFRVTFDFWLLHVLVTLNFGSLLVLSHFILGHFWLKTLLGLGHFCFCITFGFGLHLLLGQSKDFSFGQASWAFSSYNVWTDELALIYFFLL